MPLTILLAKNLTIFTEFYIKTKIRIKIFFKEKNCAKTFSKSKNYFTYNHIFFAIISLKSTLFGAYVLAEYGIEDKQIRMTIRLVDSGLVD